MARYSVSGDEDGNEDRPTNRPLPKCLCSLLPPSISFRDRFTPSIAPAVYQNMDDQLTPPVRGLSSLAKVRAVKNKAATTVESKIVGGSESLLRDFTGKAIQSGVFYPCRGGSPHLALTHEDILHSNQDVDSSKINSR